MQKVPGPISIALVCGYQVPVLGKALTRDPEEPLPVSVDGDVLEGSTV